MSKTKEQIQQDLLERFGIEIDADKCETYNKAYGFLTSTATLATVKIVNEDKLRAVVGDRDTFFKELNESNPKIKDKIIKRFYFKNVHIISPVIDGKEASDLQKKEKVIQELADIFGLNFLESYIEEFNDKSFEDLRKMSQHEFIRYLFENSKMFCFDVSDAAKSRKMISYIPYKYRDSFSEHFFVDLNGENVSLRNKEEEDSFVNKLAQAGVYITHIDDSLQEITSMSALESIIREYDKYSDKIKIVFGEKSEFTGLLTNKDSKIAEGQRDKCIECIKKQLSFVELIESFDVDEELVIDDIDIDLPDINNYEHMEFSDIMDVPKTSDDLKDEQTNLEDKESDSDKEVKKDITLIDGLDINNDKNAIGKMIKEAYISKGKDVATILACQYVQKNRQESMINVAIGKENYIFEGEDKFLKVLNAKYIEYVLNNAKEIEYNFDMDPKARRLGEAVIAMYSNMKSLNIDDHKIMDKLNEALCELTIAGKSNKFKIDCGDKDIINIANGRRITQEEANYKVEELKYIQPYDIISTIISSEIDNICNEERITADKEKRTVDFEKNDLEIMTDTYTRMCNNMAISIDRRAKVVSSADKSTSRANIQASKTQLLMNLLKDEKVRKELNIDKKTPIWEQLKKAEEYMENKAADFFELTDEIRKVRGEIIKGKMFNSPNEEENKVVEDAIKINEEKLRQLLSKYDVDIKEEEKRKDITTYSAMQKALKALEPKKKKHNTFENEH